MKSFIGVVNRVLWENAESGRAMFLMDMETDKGLQEVKAEAIVRGISSGDCLRLDGDWVKEEFRGKEGYKFLATSLRPETPKTEKGCQRFLVGLFSETRHGIPPENIARLLTVRGPGAVKEAVENHAIILGLSRNPEKFRHAIISEWVKRTGPRRAMDIMNGAGWTEQVIRKVMEALPPESIYDQLAQNPYITLPMEGVGFEGADALANQMGIPKDDERRLVASVHDAILKQESSGSTWLPVSDFLVNVIEKIGVPQETMVKFLNNLSRASGVPAKPVRIFGVEYEGSTIAALSKIQTSVMEFSIANGISRLMTQNPVLNISRITPMAERIFARPEFARFDPVQRMAVSMAAAEPISIITGGPGTGKSTVMEAFVALEEALGRTQIVLTAPTGKAAKRLSETTKREASTLQSLLGQIPGNALEGRNTFRRNKENPLPFGITVVVDEASMIDVELMHALLEAMPADGKIVLVGDKNQLPSVGCGNVLSDLLSARIEGRRVIPSIGLVQVYRQGKDSGIAKGAALIRDGHIPDLGTQGADGVFYTEMPEERLADAMEKEVCDNLVSQGLDPIRDVAVLISQHPGPCGVHEMNRRLSRRLNPGGAHIPGLPKTETGQDGPIPRIGDRVMIRENTKLRSADEDKKNITVVNGDLGIIEGWRQDENQTFIQIRRDEGDLVELPSSKWRQLPLAYALTVHKSQGSQYRAVVMPLSGQHTMLDRTLVYTGWTRAQKTLHLIGSSSVFKKALDNTDSSKRLTLLGRIISSKPKQDFKLDIHEDWEMKQVIAEQTMNMISEKNPEYPNHTKIELKVVPSAPKGIMPARTPNAIPKNEPLFMQRRRAAITGSLGRPIPLSEKPEDGFRPPKS